MPTFVVRAPFAVVPESNRAPKMEKQEAHLERELFDLEESTKQRNLKFFNALDGIEALQKD